MTTIVRCLVSGASVAAVTFASAGVSAQNIAGEPLYGTVSLEAGFLPDPHRVTVVAGGETYLPDGGTTDALSGAPCQGYVAASQPDVRLNYSGGMLLQIGARAQADTTLLINMPDGTWRCVDDAYGLDPALTFEPAPEGQYDIWVGSLVSETAPAELLVTEFGGSASWQSAPAAGSAEATSLGSLDATLPPTWGEETLAAGFVPDPFTAGFMAAGSIDLSAEGVAPLGFVSRAPSYVINYGGGGYLKLYASSTDDLVMVVRTPEGHVLFNDDGQGLDPAIELRPAPAGAYQVWVGTVAGPGMPASATFGVTELTGE